MGFVVVVESSKINLPLMIVMSTTITNTLYPQFKILEFIAIESDRTIVGIINSLIDVHSDPTIIVPYNGLYVAVSVT